MAALQSVLVSLCLLVSCYGSTDKNTNAGDDRKLFGGYRIVPKRCTPNSEHESARADGDDRRMVCMFNYECAARNGDVVGACMDGFLFGACCRLPPGQDIDDPVVTPELIVSVTDNDIPVDEHPAPRPPMFSHLTDLLHDPGLHVSSHPDADTVLIQYPLNSTMRPPELSTFSYVGSHKDPLISNAPAPASTPKSSSIRPATTSNRMPTSTSYYPTRWPTTPIAFRPRPSSTSASTEEDEDEGLVKVPIITSPGASSTETKRPDNDVNPESISHIISILNDTNGGLVDPGPEPQPEIIDHSPSVDMPSTSGLSTWVSLNGSPSGGGTSSERPGGFTVSMSKHPMSTTMYASIPSRYPSPFTSSSTSSHHMIGPSYDVMTTQQASRPAPTVIVLGPLATSSETTMDTTTVTRRPIIITSSSTQGGFYITKRPTTNKPTSYTPIVTKKPTTVIKPTTFITNIPWEQTTHSIITKPPTTGTTIITKKPWVSIPTTTMEYPEVATVVDVNFPPVRNPQFNMSSQYERPPLPPNPEDIYAEAVAAQEEADIPTPAFMEDEKLNMKLHSFVNKIVQSLEGNFQDLEDIVYKRPNASTPTETLSTTRRPIPTTSKRPSTTRRPTVTTPTRKPTTTRPQANRPTVQSTVRPAQNARPSRPTRPTLRPLTNRPSQTPRPQTSRPSQTVRPAQSQKPTQSSKPIRPQSTRPPQTSRPGQTSRPTSRPAQSTTVKTSSRPTPSRRPTTTRRPVTKRSTTTSSQQLITQETTKTTPSKTSVTKGEAISSTEESVTLADAIDLTTEPPPTTTSTTAKPINYKNECGVRPLMSKKTGRIVGGKGATFGAWPWQVLVRESTWLGLFTKNKCGGVLITSRFVITAAHCQPGFLANLVAVLGEYDLSGELESRRSVTRNVRRVIVHRQYDAATFANDLALLELETPVAFDEHIVPICMPRESQDFTGRMATVTGWGRLKYGGGVPSVLQEVQVPVIENSVCQEMFNTAGHSKVILNSFLCAGYANGQKDSCEGDSGGPLMMEREDGRWVLIGTVSHGIKCAAPYLPGVYMRTTYYKPWLSQITGVK